MKRKLFLLLCALLTMVGVQAATDVTASYIGNVERIINGGGHNCNNKHKLSDSGSSQGEGYFNTQTLSGWHNFVANTADVTKGFESWTAGAGSEGWILGRVMVLPQGRYTLKFTAMSTNQGGTLTNTVVKCGNEEKGFAGQGTYDEYSFDINVTTANTAYEFGIYQKSGGTGNWSIMGNISLTLNSTDVYPIANNSVDGWTYSGTQTWHTNTWSTEGNRDNTKFITPFSELWVASGGTLADATIKRSFTPTESGVYKVSAWVRAMNESSGAISGAKIFVGDTEADACGGAAITNGSLGTFTAMADGVAGTPFEYGFELKDATINWLSFKNVTITYLGEIPEAEVEALLDQVPTGKMAASVQTELNNRVSALEDNASVANYNALASYIATANASINDYSNLQTAINNARSYTIYKPVFSASETLYQAGITAAQNVYDNASADNCTATIEALTTTAQNAYVSDYNIYTDDYDYSYASLLDTDMRNWTTSDWSMMNGTEHWNGITDPKQDYYEQTSEEWGKDSWSHSGTETVTLPAGNYVMGIIARADARLSPTMSVTVGENSPITTTLAHKGSSGKGVTTAGVASFGDGTFANTVGRGWEYRFISFNVPTNGTNVTISVSASANVNQAWVSLTNPLLKGDVHPNQVILNQVNSLCTTLEGYESLIHADTYDTFSGDISNAKAATVETATATLEGYVTALQNDITVASAMLAKMNSIADNKGDLTSMINGTFQTNADGWTGGTRVTWVGTQSWRGGDDAVFYELNSDGTMSYTLANMPSGSYKIVAAARAYDGGKLKAQVAGGEYGAELTGTGAAAPANGTKEINLNGVEMPYSSLGGFTSDASGHNWHWITATGTLAADGNLVINFDATGTSWMAIDDVHLYCTNLDGTSYTTSLNNISANADVANAGGGVVTCDITVTNPNVVFKSNSGSAITTAAGQDLNNCLYHTSAWYMTKMVLYDGYAFEDYRVSHGGYQYYAQADGDNSCTLYRNIPANTWCTLVLPFWPRTTLEKKYPSSLENGVLTFSDATTETCWNDEPMLIRSSVELNAITGKRQGNTKGESSGITYGDMISGEGAPMQGVYVGGTVPESGVSATNYVVSGNNLYKVNSTVNIKPFRAYFTVAGESEARLTLRIDGEDPTAINAVEAAEANDGALKDGKYLIDGKIVLVKNGVKYGANGQKLN